MPAHPERGQAAVELALALPVVVLVLLAVVQVVVVSAEQVALHHVAREAARAASLADGTSPGSEGTAAGRRAASILRTGRLALSVGSGGDEVRAEAEYRATLLPLVGRLVGPVELEAAAVMRREP